ncbi:MAG TPA: Flp pilus assembly protein CpaB [Anaeromyxobacteraceae bacterium]|nr:Flp pilus assembly protein CpaB [Anaeromyxobacteraceae bacterium]
MTALRKAADAGRRTGLRAALFLAVALAAAVASALLLTRYMEARTAAARIPTAKVVVAEVALPVGTELRAENLRIVDWPVDSRPEGTFEDPAPLVGKVVASRLVRFEPILAGKLAGGSGGGLAALLPPGMRAAAVRVDDVVGVAGFIHPGDNVDVIVTIRQDGGVNVTSSRVILQNIRVLAVGKELDTRTKGDKVVPATVATLMVEPDDSERLALAATQGKILLTLRSAQDVEVVATSGVNPAGLVGVAARPAPAQAVRAPAARRAEPAPPAKPAEVVEILRGDLFEKRNFQKEARP